MKEKTIIRVVEEDVDGCGSDAEVYVKFNSNLSSEQVKQFELILSEVKEEEIGNDFDTDDMVSEALDTFNEKFAVTGEMIYEPPYDYVVTF